MNPNKFLITNNDLRPINSQFSGIFKKAEVITQEIKQKVPIKSTQLSYEFLTPQTKAIRFAPSPNKELNLKDYFGKFMESPESMSTQHIDIVRRISSSFNDGKITIKTNSANNLTNVIYYNSFSKQVINHSILSPSSFGLRKKTQKPVIVAVKRKVGRPKNDYKRSLKKDSNSNQDDDVVKHRTKSGRIVKFTPEVAKIFQLEKNQPDDFITLKASTSETLSTEFQNLPLDQNSEKVLTGLKEPPRKQRKISAQFRCAICRKIYLGKNKMNHHYKLYPSHRPQPSDDESSLFSHLMTIVRQKRNNKDRADIFFKEISKFVHLCEKLTPRLITNQDNHPNTHHHIVDKNAASLLRINPGNYRLNMNCFDKDFKFDSPSEPLLSPNDDEIEEISENHDDQHEAPNPKPLHLDDVPSLDGNEVNLLIRQTNELTNLTNISLETEDF